MQKLKDGLRDAYSLVHERCEVEHKRQKSIYDEKVHGKPFSVDDLVWLYTPAVPHGKCRKLNHPWKGPFQILQRVSDSTYKIKCLKGNKMQCVHFDTLKPVSCSVPLISIPEPPPPTHEPPPPIPEPPPPAFEPPPLGWSDELLEDSDDDQPYGEHAPVDENPAAVPRRYPLRQRQLTDRDGPYVQH